MDADPYTDDDGCMHGLWPASSCSICNGKDKAEAEAQWHVEYNFSAKFDSECKKCDGAIFQGDQAAMTTSGKVICRHCADPFKQLRRG